MMVKEVAMTPADPNAPALDPTGTPTAPAPTGAHTVDLLAEPTVEECITEWNRYYDDQRTGRLSYAGIPEGHFVAYFGGRIVDHDVNFIALQHRAATAIGVHWARFVIDYPWA
jgi:hypothetical protein